MSERRFTDFGRMLPAEDRNAAQAAVTHHGVLHGMALSASEDGVMLSVSPGASITQDGVIIENQDSREIEFPVSSVARVVTVCLVHVFNTITAGQGSNIELRDVTDEEGDPIFATQVLDEDEEQEGLVIGWVNYPGGSVPLDDSMIFRAPTLRRINPWTDDTVENAYIDAVIPIDVSAPFISAPNVLVLPEDGDVVGTHDLGPAFFPRSTWVNNHGSTTKALDIVLTPVKPVIFRPKCVKITYATSHASSAVQVFVVKGGSQIYIGTVSGIVTGERTFRIPDSIFAVAPIEDDTRWAIMIRLTIPALQETALSRVQVDAGPVPTVP